MAELRVSVDDLRATASSLEARARKLADSASTGGGPSFQPSAAAVKAIYAGAAVTRTTLSARTTATGVRVAEADARYVSNEAKSVDQVRAVYRG